jgi:hypothetical protein
MSQAKRTTCHICRRRVSTYIRGTIRCLTIHDNKRGVRCSGSMQWASVAKHRR